jgi:hypothetical protein
MLRNKKDLTIKGTLEMPLLSCLIDIELRRETAAVPHLRV